MYDKIRILVGIDGSVQSQKALNEAITIASHFSGFIRVITVYDKGSEKKAEALIADAQQKIEKEGLKCDASMILGSTPAIVLPAIAKQENIDLIIVGSRGLGGKVSMLLGSVSKKVVGDAYCNVLVVKK
jgi:nucleotide-binding universal stress UspA family protein